MDKVFGGFLRAQHAAATALAEASDILAVDFRGPQHALASFACKGLVRDRAGNVVEADRFAIGIFLHDGYLRRALPPLLFTVITPTTVWHPNVNRTAICIGPIEPGTGIVDLLHRLYEVITYQNLGTREDDALQPEACAWARHNMGRFPLDARPLKRPRFHPPPGPSTSASAGEPVLDPPARAGLQEGR
jgi:hypothetical protein